VFGYVLLGIGMSEIPDGIPDASFHYYRVPKMDNEFSDYLEEMINKRKTQPMELYLVSLWQVLIGQAELLSRQTSGRAKESAKRSVRLARRIEQFLKHKE